MPHLPHAPRPRAYPTGAPPAPAGPAGPSIHELLDGLGQNPFSVARRNGYTLVLDIRECDPASVTLRGGRSVRTVTGVLHEMRQRGVVAQLPGANAAAVMRAATLAVTCYRDALRAAIARLTRGFNAAIDAEKAAYADLTWQRAERDHETPRGEARWSAARHTRAVYEEALSLLTRALESVTWRTDDETHALYNRARRDTPRFDSDLAGLARDIWHTEEE